MAKKDFSGALKGSLKTSGKAVEDRFAKADAVLLNPAPAPAPAAPVAVAPPKPEAPASKPRPSPAPQPTSSSSPLVVRDTFSMPPSDYALIEQLRERAARQGRIATKSECVRAGLQALLAMGDADLVSALDRLERIKPGRKG